MSAKAICEKIMLSNIKAIAYYLPQFHPIPENDSWWGKGFTEWTNTAKAKPLFRGHYQPHVPADLGFYDLRVPETRAAQAEMAREYGVYGFCYYHYWFAGKRVLERPFNEVLQSKQPDFPFCLCWANQTWTGVWHGAPNRILIEQTYPGISDHQRHFATLLPAFLDERYIKVDNKPIFFIYEASKLPEPRRTIELWQNMAIKAGLVGIHFVSVSGIGRWNPLDHGFDAISPPPNWALRPWGSPREPLKWLKNKFERARGLPTIERYEKWLRTQKKYNDIAEKYYPCVTHAWDNTPRSGKNGFVLKNSSPELFKMALEDAIESVQKNPDDRKIIMLKSWNEWAEGNHLEPDLKSGDSYLIKIRETIKNF